MPAAYGKSIACAVRGKAQKSDSFACLGPEYLLS
jgi:hypothetical protein